MNRIFYYTLIIGSLICCACTSKDEHEEMLEQALYRAKENRQELEKVLHLYENDSEKLAAARFLIENMPYHFATEQYYVSHEKEKYRPDITTFDGHQSVKNHCDSLERSGYTFASLSKCDVSTLDSSFLVNNIELAFAVRQKPWAKNVSFEDFCRYVLPYRAQSEAVSNLRNEIMERFVPLLDSAKVNTPLEACRVLNEQLKGILKIGRIGLPFYPTLEETYRSGFGQCEGLCDLGVFIMRACGIPAAAEQAVWTKMDQGHNWCTILDNGKFYSFNPGENQPGELALLFTKNRYLCPAKVYRLRFDADFSKVAKNDDGYFIYLKMPLIQDVTNEYLDKPAQIEVLIDKKNGEIGKSNQVYLCTYNYYEWYPIAIGHRKDSICYFENVVGDNVFMVFDSPGGVKLQNITAPFYVNSEGQVHKFIPQKEHKQTFTLNKRKKKQHLIHTLYYWDIDKDQFIPLKYMSLTDTTQTYDQIPGNALLWFTIPELIRHQRIFFIENDTIRFY